ILGQGPDMHPTSRVVDRSAALGGVVRIPAIAHWLSWWSLAEPVFGRASVERAIVISHVALPRGLGQLLLWRSGHHQQSTNRARDLVSGRPRAPAHSRRGARAGKAARVAMCRARADLDRP